MRSTDPVSPALLTMLGVQEGVRVEALGVERDVHNAEIEQEHKNQEWNCDKWLRRRGWDDDFQQGVAGVQRMLGDL